MLPAGEISGPFSVPCYRNTQSEKRSRWKARYAEFCAKSFVRRVNYLASSAARCVHASEFESALAALMRS